MDLNLMIDRPTISANQKKNNPDNMSKDHSMPAASGNTQTEGPASHEHMNGSVATKEPTKTRSRKHKKKQQAPVVVTSEAPAVEEEPETPQTQANVSPEQETGEEVQKLRQFRDFIYQQGFIEGKMSDVTLHAFESQEYRLHRLVLSQSPFLERLLNENSGSDLNSRDLYLPITEHYGNSVVLTPESLHLCLCHLYGSSSITSDIGAIAGHGNLGEALTRLFALLVCSSMFELSELSHQCHDHIISMLTVAFQEVDNVDLDFILFSINTVQNIQSFDMAHSIGAGILTAHMESIRTLIVNQLACELPKKLNAFPDLTSQPEIISAIPQLRQLLIQIYARLPFDWLKSIIEDGLQLASEFEKHQFAKQVIDFRKIRGESVVLVFDRQMRGRTQVVYQQPVLRSESSSTSISRTVSPRASFVINNFQFHDSSIN